jgi:hypothetical protein
VSSNARDTQFQGFANALHKELVAIHYEGYTNNWNNVDIDRRVIQAIARRTYDFTEHVFSSCDVLNLDMGGIEGPRNASEVPDMTSLPKEQE